MMIFRSSLVALALVGGAGALVFPSTLGSDAPAKLEATPAPGPGIFHDSSKLNAWAIKGRVIVKIAEGIFVRCQGGAAIDQRKPKGGEVVFLRDPFPDYSTFRDVAVGTQVERQGYSIGILPNQVGHGVPPQVHGFELR